MNVLIGKTITDVPGILASGISIGIKKDNKKDLCIIYSMHKAASAAVFTTNKVKAAPLIIDMENIENDNTQAIVINSGNANSCTGSEGLLNAKYMAETAAKHLELSLKEVLVASTGALAVQLPMDKIIPGIEKACLDLSDNAGLDAAEAILTTDTRTKTIAVEFEIQGKKVTMAGMTKGSSMIHPNMGTNLSFIVTDANISKRLLHRALKESIDMSFNMVSIDGDTSTNDMAVILANGASNHPLIDQENDDYNVFSKALNFVSIELAKMIVKDGEGATKFIEVELINAKTLQDAKKGARTVISSNLIKCESFGSAIKWPIIACVLGYSNIEMKPEDLDIFIGNGKYKLQIVKAAAETNYDKELAKQILSGEDIKILIDLKIGEWNAVSWGCDLSYNYVKANGYLN